MRKHASLEARMLCSNCGRENRTEAAFCDNCGAPLSAPNVHADDLFVGRERELAMIRAALEQTVAGRGRVMMVCGEPGIGKTHTAQWFSHYAEQRKVQVLWGRSHEESGAPPYRPWLQAIRDYLETQDDTSIQASLGNAASSIAEIVPEIAQRLPDLPSLPTTSDAAAARFRLFDAITGFWKRAAAEQPLALIFDDLHWADTPSLKLLEFLAAELRASRLFVLGTYRDVELTRAHPLSNTLGELARHSGFQRLRLTGLSFNETRQLMSTAAGQSLPSDLIAEIHTLTEGNPLFLAEMTRFLLHEGVLGASRDSRHPGRFRATLALFEGRLDECERLAGQGWAMGRRLPGQDVDGVYGLQMFSLRREQGRLHELAPLVSQFVQTTPQALTWRPGLALIYAELGFTEKARAEFANLADDFSAIPRDGVWPACIVYLAEVCAFLEDAERAHTLYRFLLPYDGHNMVVGGSAACYGAAARFLGMLATTMKQWEDAERHFEAALEMNARQGARLWLAHTQYQYALMLIARRHPGDREQAESLWQEALATSREVGMRALEQRITGLQRQADYPSARQRYPAGLSRREVEVLRLVAAGKANRDIAKRLFVSENTVANHMRSILAKTNTVNRTEAAAFATRHGLLGDSSEGG